MAVRFLGSSLVYEVRSSIADFGGSQKPATRPAFGTVSFRALLAQN